MQYNSKLTPKSGAVQELTTRLRPNALAHAKGSLRQAGEVPGLMSRAEPRSSRHNRRLTPRSGEVQEIDAKSGEVQEADAEGEEVQEADDEEWGSATATGGEAGECRKAVERGEQPPEQPT
jgi:hypothetical protein